MPKARASIWDNGNHPEDSLFVITQGWRVAPKMFWSMLPRALRLLRFICGTNLEPPILKAPYRFDKTQRKIKTRRSCNWKSYSSIKGAKSKEFNQIYKISSSIESTLLVWSSIEIGFCLVWSRVHFDCLQDQNQKKVRIHFQDTFKKTKQGGKTMDL